MRSRNKWMAASVAVVFVVVGGVAVYVGAGFYDIGADSSHWPVTLKLLRAVRNRSIARHSAGLQPPDLDDPRRILVGAAHYHEMCEQCHLAPGRENSEIRTGLYPQPPDLAQTRVAPRAVFWVVKHGIKMSGMPAWGRTHDDATIWDIVAFVHELPRLTPAQYRAIVARAPPVH